MRPHGRGFQQPYGGGQQRRDAPRSWRTRFPLPSDVAQLLKTERGKCDNLGLWLDRFVDWTDQDERGRNVELQQMMATKKRQAPMIARGAIGVMDMQKVRTLVEACWQRTEQELAAFKRRGYHVPQPLTLSPDYRLVVGFGAEHVLETNLYLHRIYGFPIIPGSAVKGVTRTCAFWEIAEHFNIPEKALGDLDRLLNEGKENAQKALWEQIAQHIAPTHSFDDWQAQAALFYAVFGTTDQQGQVIFFDAYPTQAPKLELDILNPHYGEYYQGSNRPPADYLDPSPTYFLTVAKDSPFEFAVASKDSALADTAQQWLKSALSELGIGGKTAAGYGFMKTVT